LTAIAPDSYGGAPMKIALRVAAFTYGLALSIGCASSDDTAGDPDSGAGPADAAEIDGRADARVDADVPDAAPDTTSDADTTAASATPDASTTPDADTTPDASAPDAPDTTPDAGPAEVDAGPDASPSGVVIELVPGTNTAQRGSTTGGTAYNDACPTGQVLTGFRGSLVSANGYHGQIGARCGIPAVVTAGEGLAIEIHAGEVLPMRGLHNAAPWTRDCPANQVLTGFGGRGGFLIDQLTFRCAPLAITTDGATYTVTIGATTDLEPAGGNGGNAFTRVDCAAGQIASVARLRAGDGLDAIGLGCSTPTAH
jgi:hypothetical protein